MWLVSIFLFVKRATLAYNICLTHSPSQKDAAGNGGIFLFQIGQKLLTLAVKGVSLGLDTQCPLCRTAWTVDVRFVLNGACMSFSMNYTIEAEPKRKIIREKIYGIWKEHTAKSYYDDFAKEVEPLIKGKWAKLIDLRNWKSSYPEIIEVIGQHLKWCRENGMILSVNVIDNPVTHAQLKRMFIIGGTEEISKVFRSVEEADKYLSQNGF